MDLLEKNLSLNTANNKPVCNACAKEAEAMGGLQGLKPLSMERMKLICTLNPDHQAEQIKFKCKDCPNNGWVLVASLGEIQETMPSLEIPTAPQVIYFVCGSCVFQDILTNSKGNSQDIKKAWANHCETLFGSE
ncbi:hypothetical protein BDF21DRAFT_420504, partial [Thamnidium elegans]